MKQAGSYRPTWVEVDLDAITANLQAFRGLYPSQKLMAVVKADAYGHGAAQVAREAVYAGADYVGVALLDEAIELRRSGLKAPLLVLGYTSPENAAMREAIRYGIALTFFRRDVLQTAAEVAKEMAQEIILHLKVDTGMNRVGVRSFDEVAALLQEAASFPYVRVEGMFTHFATADEKEKKSTEEQFALFSEWTQRLVPLGLKPPLLHCANSAAAIDLPHTALDMLRIGISLYGLYPSQDVCRTRIRLQPAMSLKSELAFVKHLQVGEGVGYGATYKADEPQWIGTVPVGYADGFSRVLSNRADVLLGGRRCPVVGRVSMDQLTIRLPYEVKCGQEIVLFGRQQGSEIPIEEIAEKLQTISYEVACLIGYRVPRHFVKRGQICSVRNPLIDPIPTVGEGCIDPSHKN